MSFTKIAGAALVAATLSTAAHATVIGSFSGALGGTTATPNNAISSGTVTSLASPGSATTSGSGDFSAVGFLTASGPAFTLDLTSLTSTVLDTGAGTFTASAALPVILNTTNNTLEVKLTGDFTGAGVLAAYNTPMTASLDLDYTQVGGVGTAISGSYTIAVPAAFTVPEPISMAILGTGLAGLGLVRRARRA